MSTESVTVSFDEDQIEALDRAVTRNAFTDRAELVETTVSRYLHRQLLEELKGQSEKRQLTGEELAEELKALKQIRRKLWKRDYGHLFSGQ